MAEARPITPVADRDVHPPPLAGGSYEPPFPPDMAQSGDPGPFDWARAAPAASARPSRTGTRMVTPMAKRLLRLLLAHPELVAALGDQQLEIVCQSPHLVLDRKSVV